MYILKPLFEGQERPGQKLGQRSVQIYFWFLAPIFLLCQYTVYRVSHRFVLNFDVNFWFFWLSYQKRHETWISITSFKYFQVVMIEKQIRLFVFWEKLRLDYSSKLLFWDLLTFRNCNKIVFFISEILSSQRPGQRPIQIHQRPFHTRIKITKTKLPPPFAAGIPLPEVLIPGFEMPTTPQG